MTKKERVLAVLRGEEVEQTPASFSLHFPREKAFGEEGVKSHLEFFKKTDTDILKIMNENLIPALNRVSSVKDYADVKNIRFQDSFISDQIELVKRILDRCERDAFVIGTLHGVTASCLHPMEQAVGGYETARTLLCKFLREDRHTVSEVIKRIVDIMARLAYKYIELGVDGVYYAALGGERRYFTDEEFEEFIEPADKIILQAVKEAGGYSFLHICKNGLNMERYRSYASYGDVVNWGVYEAPFSLEEGRDMFPDAVLMGGLPNRTGVLVHGTEKEIRSSVKGIIQKHGRCRLILGADCTLATEQDLDRVRVAVEAAREND
jgi:uroporphyrinogen decarboxylase